MWRNNPDRSYDRFDHWLWFGGPLPPTVRFQPQEGSLPRLLHKARRGPQDPTWLAGWVGIIACGRSNRRHRSSGTWNQPGNESGRWSAGITLAAVGVREFWLCFVLAIIRYFEDNKSPFKITHNRGTCSDCLENVTTVWGPAQQVRLHVTNRSRVGVQRVRAYMRVLQAGALTARDHFLHVEHDNDPNGVRQLSRMGEYLTVGQPVHFDVALVASGDDATGTRTVIRFEYPDPAISDGSEIPLGSGQIPATWKLRVEVSGWTDFRDVVPAFVDCGI